MDIQIYEDIKADLQEHFASLKLTKSYSPNIVGFSPSQPTYPMIVFQEINNMPYENFRGSLETIANLGYQVDIYAKMSGSLSKQHIARTLGKYANDFLTQCINLRQVSYNEFDRDGTNGDLYRINIRYSAPYYEQRKQIL